MDLSHIRCNIARRGTDNPSMNMQYHTPRGVIPVQVVNDQAARIPDVARIRPGGIAKFPHRFRNDAEQVTSDPECKSLFAKEELKDDGERLYEFPVDTPDRLPFNMDRRSAKLSQVNELKSRTAADIMANPPNDPGPFRGIVPAYPGKEDDKGSCRPPIGLIYHPVGNPAGFARALLEPLDREGRLFLLRHKDDKAVKSLGRTGTWPHRNEDANDLTTSETRRQVNVPQESRRYKPATNQPQKKQPNKKDQNKKGTAAKQGPLKQERGKQGEPKPELRIKEAAEQEG